MTDVTTSKRHRQDTIMAPDGNDIDAEAEKQPHEEP